MTVRQASDHPQTHHHSPRNQPPPQPRHSTHQEPVPARSACTPPSSSTRPHSPERGPCRIANQNAKACATGVWKLWKLFMGKESLASRDALDSAAAQHGNGGLGGPHTPRQTPATSMQFEEGNYGRIPPSAPRVTSPSIRAPSLNVQSPSTVREDASLRLGAPPGKRFSKSPTSL